MNDNHTQTDRGQVGAARPRTVAVAHPSGDALHVVVVQSEGGSASVIAAERLAPGIGSRASVASVADRYKADATVVIEGGAVCRAVEVPQDTEDVISDALALLAEAELPDAVPWYRRGSGPVPGGATAGMQAGLLVGLPGSPEDTADEDAASGTTLTAEVCAAASLLASLVKRGRPIGCITIADRSIGTISVVAFGEHATIARSAFEPCDDPSAFEAGVERVVENACRRAGVEPSDRFEGSSSSRRLILCGPVAADGVDAVSRMARGASSDPGWAASYAPAVAVGIAVLRDGVQPGGLVSLLQEEPREKRSRSARVASALSGGPAMLTAAAVAVFAIVLLPALAEYVRMTDAEARVAAYESVLDAAEDGDGPTTDQLIGYYGLVERERVPMTKLLADLAAALPADSPREIVLVERLTLDREDGFTVEGTTRDPEHPASIVRALGGSGVFTDIDPQRIGSPDEPGAPIEFEVQGGIRSPWADARDLRDYATHPAAEFIYGLITDEQIAAAEKERLAAERAAREAERRETEIAARVQEGVDAEQPTSREDEGAPDGPAIADASESTGDDEAVAGVGDNDSVTEINSGRRRTADGSSRRPIRDESAARAVAEGGSEEIRLSDDEDREDSRRRVFEGGSRTEQEEAKPDPIPELLTDEAISAMDNIQALQAMVARSRIIRNREDELDADTLARLRDEVQRLRDRAREAREERQS